MTHTDSKTGKNTYPYRRDVILDMKFRKERFGTPYSISMSDHSLSRSTFNRWEKEVEAKEKGADRSTGLTPDSTTPEGSQVTSPSIVPSTTKKGGKT